VWVWVCVCVCVCVCVQERENDADGMTQERPLLQIPKDFPRHRDILSFFHWQKSLRIEF